MQFTYPSMRKGHDLFGRWRKESDPPTSDVRDLPPGRPRVVDYSNFVGRPDDSSRTGCPLPSVDPELLGQVSKRRPPNLIGAPSSGGNPIAAVNNAYNASQPASRFVLSIRLLKTSGIGPKPSRCHREV